MANYDVALPRSQAPTVGPAVQSNVFDVHQDHGIGSCGSVVYWSGLWYLRGLRSNVGDS